MGSFSTPQRLRSAPPEAWPPLLRVARLAVRPLERFLQVEAASGILLLLAAAVAMAWANSPWSSSYQSVWALPVGVRFGGLVFERSLGWVVNDVLMAIFFFVVGLEIRRELHCGELSQWRRAALPAAAALGGMLVPAMLYLFTAPNGEARRGWGVPMATDIAFAVGVLTLLGKRVPAALRVLLLALAVIDDLGAIVIIAVFYSSNIHAHGFALAGAGVGGILLLQRFGMRSKAAYVLPACLTWAGIYIAGVHPTIAGVLVGLLTPVRAWLGREGFVADVREELGHLESTVSTAGHEELVGSLKHVELARREAISPAESLIHTLHPWVAFGIMPLFALANAGVDLSSSAAGAQRVTGSVAAALLFGKPLGIWLFCSLVLKLGLARLPTGVTWRHLVVLGVVAGIGFTMSLFVAQLAFTAESLLQAAKVGVLLASASAAVASLLSGWLLLPRLENFAGAHTADEAEASTEH